MEKEKPPVYQKLGGKGHYSQSERLDPRQFEEKDLDLPHSEAFWFEQQLFSEEFKQETLKLLKKWEITLSPSTFHDFHFHMIGQSHIDMAWLWRYEQTRKKGLKTLRKVITHAQQFPKQFKYALSSPQLLHWIKEDDPELFREILDFQKSGHIELVGGSWVEPDCMMPTGEAMVRQRLYGMKFYRDEFGTLPEVEWFLDSFGYNRGLPQILVKSGAKFFWTTKITWNKETTFPFVNFFWESPDGSRLLTANFGQNLELFDQWEQFKAGRYQLLPEVSQFWDYEKDYSHFHQYTDPSKPLSPVGFFYGAGDGGHGPSHMEVTRMLIIQQIMEQRGVTWNWSSVRDFFIELSTFQDQLPVWQDELYLETHRGTFTVHGPVKRNNRRLESRILALERLATIVNLYNSSYPFPYSQLESLWKNLLLNQFHDVLPGSSIQEVFDDVYDLWKRCDLEIQHLIEQMSPFMIPDLPKEQGTQNPLLLFNPLSWTRKARVFIPITALKFPPKRETVGSLPYARFFFRQNNSVQSVICQPIQAEFQDEMHNHPEGWWTIIELAGESMLTGILKFEPVNSPPIFVTTDKTPRMTNRHVTLEFDPKTGNLNSLRAQNINQAENLVYGNQNLLLVGYKDKGSITYPAWDLAHEYWKVPLQLDQSQDLKISVQNQGPIFSTLRFSRTLADTTVVQTVTLFQDDPMVYCTWSADWKLRNALLKIGLHTNTKATTVTADQMYCAQESSTLPDTPADKARFEKIMHKFVDVSTPKKEWGIAVINEGKYAYDASGGRIRISLHRSPKYPRPSAESWVNTERSVRRKEKKGYPIRYSGLGPISARFAILPHQGGALENHEGGAASFVPKQAEEFNNPVVVIQSGISHQQRSSFPSEPTPNTSGILNSINSFDLHFHMPHNIQMKVFKREEWKKSGDYILRFVELCGRQTNDAKIIFPEILAKKDPKIVEVDLLERPLSHPNFEWIKGEHKMIVDFKPFEIKTFKIQL